MGSGAKKKKKSANEVSQEGDWAKEWGGVPSPPQSPTRLVLLVENFFAPLPTEEPSSRLGEFGSHEKSGLSAKQQLAEKMVGV